MEESSSQKASRAEASLRKIRLPIYPTLHRDSEEEEVYENSFGAWRAKEADFGYNEGDTYYVVGTRPS